MKRFGRMDRQEKTEKTAANELSGREAVKNEGDGGLQDGVLTLYSCRKGGDEVAGIAKRLFSEMTERFIVTDEGSFQVLLKDGTSVHFHVMANTEENRAQANGMAHFFAQAPLENEGVKRAALQQISLFNCIVGIGFQIDHHEQRTNYIIHTIYRIADELVAFVLHPNMYLYRSDGRLLISIDGKTDFEQFYPQAHSGLLERDAQETDADRARKRRSIGVLKEKGIPFIEHLKAAVYESECRIPEKSEVVGRLSAVFAAAVISEVYASGGYEEPQEVSEDQLEQMEEQYQVSRWLSQEEQAYIENPQQRPLLHNKFGWRYECCSVLMWALSLIELKSPDQICDAAELGSIMWNNTFDSLMKQSTLRSRDEILDMQDLVFRYDWACVDARIHQKELEGLNGEIVYEWHYALNWLVGADGNREWDEVVTTT